MRYFIHEANLERLEKRLTTIQNKCNKLDVAFCYEVVGEEYREFEKEDGSTSIVRFVEVEASGQVNHGPWQFIGVVEHTPSGNVIRKHAEAYEEEIPEKYYHTGKVCECCNTVRNRKDTYLIRNTESGEWKQVGKSCLKEFTCGLDADDVARYISLWDEMIKGESVEHSDMYIEWHEVKEFLNIAFATVKKYGYVRVDDDSPYTQCTKHRATDYYHCLCRGWHVTEAVQEEVQDLDVDSVLSKVDDAIAWITNEDPDNEYIRNLKTLCSNKYCRYADFGILASLPVAYERHLKYVAEVKAREEAAEARRAALADNFLGEVGDRLDIAVASARCVTSWYNQYGETYMYEFIAEDGHVIMWKTSSWVDTDEVHSIKGTVKEHEEYNGIKQTWLTRCKIA